MTNIGYQLKRDSMKSPSGSIYTNITDQKLASSRMRVSPVSRATPSNLSQLIQSSMKRPSGSIYTGTIGQRLPSSRMTISSLTRVEPTLATAATARVAGPLVTSRGMTAALGGGAISPALGGGAISPALGGGDISPALGGGDIGTEIAGTVNNIVDTGKSLMPLAIKVGIGLVALKIVFWLIRGRR